MARPKNSDKTLSREVQGSESGHSDLLSGILKEDEAEIKKANTDYEPEDEDDPGIHTTKSEARETPGPVAASLLHEQMRSEPPPPPESQDIEYLSYEEIRLDDRINTYTTMRVEDPEAGKNHAGPWIERCVGRSPETKKLQVVRIPAKEIPIEPLMVMKYLGNVVQDHLAVHTGMVVHRKKHHGYSFDHFFIHNGKRLDRCCLVLDRIHQAALLYEKVVSKKTRKPFAVIRQIRGTHGQRTGNPAYDVIGAKEADYRDLKRLFERHFLRRGDEELADDIGLKALLGSSY